MGRAVTAVNVAVLDVVRMECMRLAVVVQVDVYLGEVTALVLVVTTTMTDCGMYPSSMIEWILNS